MDKIDIKNVFRNAFMFLTTLGYDKVEIYENSVDYKLGITMENIKINQKVSFAFYEKNPLNTNSNFEYGLLLKLFKGSEHLDFSRLLKKHTELSKYSQYQYFIVPIEYKLEDFIGKISKIIFESYEDILLGNNWVNVVYDLRDDY